MEETEYLATIDAVEIESDSALFWLRELRRYRKERENEKKGHCKPGIYPDWTHP